MKEIKNVWVILLLLAVSVMAAFLILPLISVFLNMTPEQLWSRLTTPVALQALKLSIYTTSISLGFVLLFGTPLSYILAFKTFPGKRILEVCTQLPIVIPPAVAG